MRSTAGENAMSKSETKTARTTRWMSLPLRRPALAAIDVDVDDLGIEAKVLRQRDGLSAVRRDGGRVESEHRLLAQHDPIARDEIDREDGAERAARSVDHLAGELRERLRGQATRAWVRIEQLESRALEVEDDRLDGGVPCIR